MSAPSAPKSQGMRFAEEQLQRHGWTEGKGLGKRESGISEAVKVKVKCDKAGVGHDSAEQFTFHWWDHVFNKTAASISVEADQFVHLLKGCPDVIASAPGEEFPGSGSRKASERRWSVREDGVQVKKMKEEEFTVTNKKPRKALARSNMLYGRFVKSATLLSGGEEPVEKPSSSESSDSEDEDEKLDLSSAAKMSDENLIKICGGRTAHKGARHGLTMSAKLSRLEEQERAFLDKYGNKEQNKNKKEVEPVEDNWECPKKHKKNKKHSKERESNATTDNSSESVKKKRKNIAVAEEAEHNGDEEVEPGVDRDVSGTKKKKRKKHRQEPVSPKQLIEQDKESIDSYMKAKKKKKHRVKSVGQD